MAVEVKSLEAFVRETRADVNSPPTSSFYHHMPAFRDWSEDLAHSLLGEDAPLRELRRCAKGLAASQRDCVRWEKELATALEALATYHSGQGDALDPVTAKGFASLAVIFRQSMGLWAPLAQSLENGLLFPLDALREGRDEMAHLSKEVVTSVNNYQARLAKLNKQSAKEKGAGTLPSAAEQAEVLAPDRTRVQACLTQFFLLHNRQKSRRGAELILNLLDVLRRQADILAQGLAASDEVQASLAQLSSEVDRVRAKEDAERQDLHQVQDLVRQTADRLSPRPASVDPRQPCPSPSPSIHQHHHRQATSIAGTLWKRGRFGHWQRRDRCKVENDILYITRADPSEPPHETPLSECDVRLSGDDAKRFLVNHKGSAREFQTEEAGEAGRWVAVCKAAQASAFRPKEDPLRKGAGKGAEALARRLRGQAGNEACADCGGVADVSWVSTNLGVLLCIACAGIHRDLGVQVSRIQSLSLDSLAPSDFLLPLAVGNARLNSILLSKTLPGTSYRLPPDATPIQRKEYIRAKYLSLSFVDPVAELTEESLHDCVRDSNPAGLVSIFLRRPEARILANQPLILHRAISVSGANESLESLAVVALLLIHEASTSNLSSASSSSVFHLAAKAKHKRLLKLLLTSRRRDLSLKNDQGQTAAEVAMDEETAQILNKETRLEASDLLSLLPQPALNESFHSDCTVDTGKGSVGVGPLPPPRGNWSGRGGRGRGGGGAKRCRALFNCKADRADELSFRKGELIIVTETQLEGEDAAWIRGHIATQPSRVGLFPASFVTFEAL